MIPASCALRARRGPARTSASTLIMTMCFLCSQHRRAWRTPAAGDPVTSRITSMPGVAMRAAESVVIAVLSDAMPSATEMEACESYFSLGKPVRSSAARARSLERSAMAARRMPGERWAWEMLSVLLVNCFNRVSQTLLGEPSTYNMLPNLPAPISPIWIGLPLASRSASLVERLVMIGDVLSRSFFFFFLFDAEPAAAITKQPSKSI